MLVKRANLPLHFIPLSQYLTTFPLGTGKSEVTKRIVKESFIDPSICSTVYLPSLFLY